MYLEARLTRKLDENFVEGHLEELILSYLENSEKMTGYEIRKRIKRDYGVLVSNSSLYGTIRELEKAGYLKRERTEFKRLPYGKKYLEITNPGKICLEYISRNERELEKLRKNKKEEEINEILIRLRTKSWKLKTLTEELKKVNK